MIAFLIHTISAMMTVAVTNIIHFSANTGLQNKIKRGEFFGWEKLKKLAVQKYKKQF